MNTATTNEQAILAASADARAAKLRAARTDNIRSTPAREPIRETSNRETDTRLQRGRKQNGDRFYIDVRIIPPGMSYEWKREAVYGQPDPVYVSQLQENHWHPVPAERHPTITVRRDGMILMERPAYLTQEARQEDLSDALEPIQSIRGLTTQVPDGQFKRKLAKVNSSYDVGVVGQTMTPED